MTAGFKAIVYCELTESDISKAHARANKSQTGGGARDLRFPFQEFNPIFSKMLSERRTVNRVGAYSQQSFGYILDNPGLTPPIASANLDELIWEPPTISRPKEGRLAKIHLLRGVSRLFRTSGTQGLKFLILIKGEDGFIRAHLASSRDILDDKWNRVISDPIKSKLRARQNNEKNSHKRIMGWIDSETGDHAHG